MDIISIDFVYVLISFFAFLISTIVLHEWGHCLWSKYVDKNFLGYRFKTLRILPDAVRMEPIKSRASLCMGFIFSLPALVFLPNGIEIFQGIIVLGVAATMDFAMAIMFEKTKAMDRLQILDSLGIRPVYPKLQRKRWQRILFKVYGLE